MQGAIKFFTVSFLFQLTRQLARFAPTPRQSTYACVNYSTSIKLMAKGFRRCFTKLVQNCNAFRQSDRIRKH
jgi:hypothetical protein